jgi:fructose-1,6-bisphosphatase/inositol monophosphatase family enzyme
MQDTDKLLDFAQRVAREAGNVILEYFEVADKSVETKADESPVTIADKQINDMVIARVTETFPNHGILGEEGSLHADRKELWVCDPIDGTRSFIQRIPTAVFSLAYVVDGQVEVAVVFDPYQNKLFSAARGKGAWVNGETLSVSSCDKLEEASIGITPGYKDVKKWRVLLDGLAEQGTNLVLVPGNVFKSTLVATSSIDGYVFPGRSAHDIAAAKLIIEEAGGKVTDLSGKEQRYDGAIYGAIISNGLLHDQLVDQLQKFKTENFIGY